MGEFWNQTAEYSGALFQAVGNELGDVVQHLGVALEECHQPRFSLSGTPVSDLAPLQNLANLKALFLDGTPVSVPKWLRKRDTLTIYGGR